MARLCMGQHTTQLAILVLCCCAVLVVGLLAIGCAVSPCMWLVPSFRQPELMEASRMLPCCCALVRLLDRLLLLLLLLLLPLLLVVVLLASTRWQWCQSAVRTRARFLRRGCMWNARLSADCSMTARLRLDQLPARGVKSRMGMHNAHCSPGCDRNKRYFTFYLYLASVFGL